VTGREFSRRARRYARRNELYFEFDPSSGKGSHGLLIVGNHRTHVQHGEIPRGTFFSMLRDLNIDYREF
jgi:hypothetical protein